MKKRISSIAIMMLCAVMLFSACYLPGNGSTPETSGKESTYTVIFLNYDNSLLYRATDIKEGEPAIYVGETPTRPDSNEYTYSFIGWDKDISAIYSNLSVFAKYSETKKTGNDDSNSGNIESDDVVASQSGEVLNKRYSTEKHSSSTMGDLMDSFYDDNYYYYYFYLGKVENVPLQSALEADYHHYTGNNYTYEFTTTKTTSKTVKESCSTAVTNTTTFSSTKNLNVGINVKVATSVEAKLSAGTFASASAEKTFEFGANVEAGYSRTTGTNDSNSRTNSYEEAATYSETKQVKVGFAFTDESKIGYYRYIMTGSVDVYTVVIYSNADKTFYLQTLTQVMSRGYSFDYSESPRFDDDQCGSLEFDCSILNDLLNYVPTKSLSETPPQTQVGDTTNFAGGRGTIDSPYLISNMTHFSNIRMYPSAVYSIIADIDAHGYRRFQPIDNFNGELRGNNHAIYNFSIEESGTATTVYIGLFKSNSGTIKNLIVGKQDNKSYDGQYSVKYDVNYIESNSATAILLVGGLVGENSGTIADCKVDNVIINATLADNNNDKSLYIMVGGITGVNKGTISGSYVRYCNIDVKSTAQTDSEDDASGWLGGICGKNESTVTQCALQFSTLKLEVSADGTQKQHAIAGGYLGGIVGEQTSGTTSGCGIYQNTLHNIAGYGDWTYWDFHRQDVIGKITGGAYY